MSSGWVASDATRHVLSDSTFSPTSLVSVAVAVDDRADFDSDYREIIGEKCQKYGIPLERPVIKDDAINKHVAEWESETARRELVEDLLQIDTLSNIHFTETTLGEPGDKVIPAYQTDPDEKRLIGPHQLRDEIFPYYNLVSIWDYFDRIDDVFKYRNVLVDDFDGKESFLWRYIGEESDEFRVIPKGDRIYPLLSLADLTMEYIKQEVDDWSDDEILDHLVEVTPGDSAYVKSYSIDEAKKLQQMAPLSKKPADTQMHYPHPTIFIHTGDNWHKKEVKALDVYDVMCEYAYRNKGCVKFFDERQDRDYMSQGDIIVCLEENSKQEYERYNNLNHKRAIDILSVNEAMKRFLDELGEVSV